MEENHVVWKWVNHGLEFYEVQHKNKRGKKCDSDLHQHVVLEPDRQKY